MDRGNVAHWNCLRSERRNRDGLRGGLVSLVWTGARAICRHFCGPSWNLPRRVGTRQPGGKLLGEESQKFQGMVRGGTGIGGCSRTAGSRIWKRSAQGILRRVRPGTSMVR